MIEKRIKDKRPSQLKLASMSEHWMGNPPKKSGKHRSQELQRIRKIGRKQERNRLKNNNK